MGRTLGIAALVLALAAPAWADDPFGTRRSPLLMTDAQGHPLARGTFDQKRDGDRIEARLEFHFPDGRTSLETAVLTVSPKVVQHSWDYDEHRGGKRMRVIINALTRIRLCTPQGHMDFSAKVAPNAWPPGLIPWFDVPDRATREVTVVFGHWSTLGLYQRENVICLDSGCVWGGALTAMRMQDRKLVQIRCKQSQAPSEE